jgi:tetratricopeptide (TPR) repeat protein
VPGAPAALAVRFDAELELGRIDDARKDLAELKSTGGPAILIREARLASVTGDATGAVGLAIDARKAAVEDEVQDLGIYDYAVGEYARLAGDGSRALASYKAALDIRPTDVGALIGMARIDAFEGKTDDAIDALRRATDIAPQPEALGLLGDLLHATDPADAAATKAFDTIRFIEQLGDIQATTYDRQLLRFDVDHGGANDALLDRVRTSVEARQDAAGHDLLAWTLYRLGRPSEAAAEIAAARGLGADDARLRFHDGAIRLAMGDVDHGRVLLRSAADWVRRSTQASARRSPRSSPADDLTPLGGATMMRPHGRTSVPNICASRKLERRWALTGTCSSRSAASTTSWVRRRTRSPIGSG